MAFTSQGRNGLKVSTETIAAMAATGTGYSSRLPSTFKPDYSKANQYVTLGVNPSAVSGTDIDFALYGSDTLGGEVKFLLLDAFVADATATGWVFGVVDLNAYPAPYYYIAHTVQASEAANTLAIRAIGPSGA